MFMLILIVLSPKLLRLRIIKSSKYDSTSGTKISIVFQISKPQLRNNMCHYVDQRRY